MTFDLPAQDMARGPVLDTPGAAGGHRERAAGPVRRTAVAAVSPSLAICAREDYNGRWPRFDDILPIRLRAEYDESVSRWLWLVKWLLLIPHLVVLIVLHIARFVVTVIAFFAILFTGRLPACIVRLQRRRAALDLARPLHGYGALGTDKYPPFTLRSTDYPADLEIDYPERLSRGLVLVKWWLLAIPHYLLIAAIAGGMWHACGRMEHSGDAGISLWGVLILIVFVALLFTGRYPRGMFDLLVGINRWIYRVSAYASLLRDEYGVPALGVHVNLVLLRLVLQVVLGQRGPVVGALALLAECKQVQAGCGHGDVGLKLPPGFEPDAPLGEGVDPVGHQSFLGSVQVRSLSGR